MYNMTVYDVCNCFTVKVFVSNFKVEKVRTWTTLSTFLRFFDMTLQKNVKSRVFWIFKKNVKNVFSNYDCRYFMVEIFRFSYT